MNPLIQFARANERVVRYGRRDPWVPLPIPGFPGHHLVGQQLGGPPGSIEAHLGPVVWRVFRENGNGPR